MQNILLLFTVLSLHVSTGFAQTPASNYSYGLQAFEEGNFAHAETLFRQALQRNSKHSESHLMLARLYLETPLRNEGKARRAIRRAVESAPGEVKYMAWQLRIWREIGSDPSWISIPMTRQARRIELASKILKLDPNNRLANEELGLHHYQNFGFYHNAISFIDPGIIPSLFVLGDTLFTFAPSQYDPVSLLNEGRYDFTVLRQALHNLSGMRPLSRQDQAVRAFVEAESFFKQILKAAPDNFIAAQYLIRLYLSINHFDRLTEVAAQLTHTHPDSANAWLYLGLGYYYRGNPYFAITAFNGAFKRLPDEIIQAFEDIKPLLPPPTPSKKPALSPQLVSRFWEQRSPRRLAPTNERKLEHYARMVYAALLLENRNTATPGWETERGEVLLRYGIPHALIQYSTAFSRVEAWDYGDLKFFFIDDGKTGNYVLYSPPAGGNPNNDFVLRARRAFRTQPERFDYTPPGERINFPYVTHSFKGPAGQTDLYVALGIPFYPSPLLEKTTIRTGAFLLDVDGRERVVDSLTAAYAAPTPHAHLDPLALWQDTRSLSAPSGWYDLATEFESSSGAFLGYQKRQLNLPNYNADSLLLSDIVLAHDVSETTTIPQGRLFREGLAIQPAVLHQFTVDAPVHVYFEMYNLRPGADGRTAYSVEAVLVARGTADAFDISGLGVSARYEGAGNATDEAQQLSMETQGLPPGKYVVAVRVRDKNSGKTVERRHRVRLLPNGT